MTETLPIPLAHLRLDRIDAEGRCPDSGDNAHHGLIIGHPKLLPDDRFAGVLQFAGNPESPDYLRLEGLVYQPGDERSGGAIGISLWLRTTQTMGTLCSSDAEAWWELSLAGDGRVQWVTHQLGEEPHQISSASLVNDGNWHHVAASFHPHQSNKTIFVDGRAEMISMQRGTPSHVSMQVDVDGTVTEEVTEAVMDFPLGSDQIRDVLLGATPSGDGTIVHNSLFSGELAALRLFETALPAEVSYLMAADQQTTFRASHPLDIAFSDDNDASVIVITDDPRAQILHLDLRNTSPWPMQLKTPEHPHPGPDNHHFRFRFRPGVLSHASLAGSLKLEKNPDWALSPPVLQPDLSVSLYFLRTASPLLEIDSTHSIRLTLSGISADASHGAHGTRIETGFGPLLGQQHMTIASGNRIKHLSVVNHMGKRHIPLHIGVTGSPRILNTGSASNRVTLHLTNTSRDESVYLNQVAHENPSRLQLSFDLQDSQEAREWALSSVGLSSSMSLSSSRQPWNLSIDERQGDQNIHWLITTSDPIQLEPGHFIELQLAGIVTNLPPGTTRGFLHYENIPGHWDGTLTFELNKSILTESHQRIGIGTNQPNTPLHIANRLDGQTDAQLGQGGLLQLGPTSGANLLIDDNELMARNNHKTSTLHLQGDGGELRLHNNKPESSKFVIKDDGKVGIGTADPSVMLQIRSMRGNSNNSALPRAELSVMDGTLRNGVRVMAGKYGPAVAAGGGPLQLFATNYNVEVTRLDPQSIKLKANAGRSALSVKAVPSTRDDGMFNLHIENSSERYKESVQPLIDDFSRILLTQPRRYSIRNADDESPALIGYLAEELDELGLNSLVIYDLDGRPDGIDYEKISLYLNEVVKDQAIRIIKLEKQVRAIQLQQCSGVASLCDGRAIVELPAEFSGMHDAVASERQLQVTLTPMGAEPFMLSYQQLAADQFLIHGSVSEGEFSWRVFSPADTVKSVPGVH